MTLSPLCQKIIITYLKGQVISPNIISSLPLKPAILPWKLTRGTCKHLCLDSSCPWPFPLENQREIRPCDYLLALTKVRFFCFLFLTLLVTYILSCLSVTPTPPLLSPPSSPLPPLPSLLSPPLLSPFPSLFSFFPPFPSSSPSLYPPLPPSLIQLFCPLYFPDTLELPPSKFQTVSSSVKQPNVAVITIKDEDWLSEDEQHRQHINATPGKEIRTALETQVANLQAVSISLLQWTLKNSIVPSYRYMSHFQWSYAIFFVKTYCFLCLYSVIAHGKFCCLI